MERNWGRGAGWLWAVLCAGCVAALAIWLLNREPGGDALDGTGLLIALPGLFVALWSAYMALSVLRIQAPDTTALSALLARQVTLAETRERTRLLGDVGTPIDVRFTLRPAPAHNAAGAAPQGSLSEVIDYYRRLRPGRLVITGAAGSGKTVLAIELLLALVEDRGPRDPVPVRMSLASWTRMPTATTSRDIGDAVRMWMRRHLMDTFQLSRAAATALVEDGLILPVLDGLDEMDGGGGDAPRARRAMRELDAYRYGRPRAGMILTSRSAAYDALGTHARDTARVEIAPVSAARAHAFISTHTQDPARWHDVLRELDTAPAGPLAQGLSTPWRLTMAVTLYEQRDPATGNHPHTPADLLVPARTGAEAVRDHLVDLFLHHAATGHLPPPGRMTQPQVHARLHVLARHLEDNMGGTRVIQSRALSGIDLIPHELWPLVGNRRVRAAQVLLYLAIAALVIAIGMRFLSSDVDHYMGFRDIPDRELFIKLLAMLAPILLFGVVQAWVRVWPSTHRLGPPSLRSPRDWGRAVTRLISGATTGFLIAVAVGSIILSIINVSDGNFHFELDRYWLWERNLAPMFVAVGVLFGIPAGFMFGLVGGVFRKEVSEVGDPRRLIRDDLLVALITVVLSLAPSFLLGFVSVPDIPVLRDASFGYMLFVPLAGVLALVTVGLASVPASVRYIVFLLFTRFGRHRLPWRLGRFLHWATQVGIMRTAGTAYQFRHRELQDWLAHRPAP
ncbi:NACHT domain-containing protein [Streptomyces sp. NPDC033538]|uniref:NACHT domain-containing protein n=1 Tax=Streptomyces sp. NPDC033538 TaxID=3155367 RepID=UPI0033FEDF20